MGFLAFIISESRLKKVTVIFKPATLLAFHKALVKRKYSKLYSNKAKKTPERKPQDQALIDLVIEMKKRNPSFGYWRIAMQIFEAFWIEISRFAVGRILCKYKHRLPTGDGPSWLKFIGHMKDSLWSVDLFRCESMSLRSHWVMVVIDQYTRRIIGFAVHAGDCDGIAYCRMFNSIIAGTTLPKYLSSDNDPVFLFHRWKANLRVIDVDVDVDEIKSVPGVPTSHPFVERIIKSCRHELLDQQFFWDSIDLQRKLNHFQQYYNETRVYSSLGQLTPNQKAGSNCKPSKNIISLESYRWKSHCRRLYQLPTAA